MDIKLELIAVPVTDVDVAKDFYVRAGFNADHDQTVSDETPLRPADAARFGVLDLHR